MGQKDSSCEFAPQLREIERRAQEDILDALKSAFGEVDPATLASLLSGDYLEIIRAIMSLDLEGLASVAGIVATAEEIAADHKAIVSAMETRCAEGNGNGNGEEPEKEISVSSKDDRRIFTYPEIGNAPRVEFRRCGVAIYGKRDIPEHDTPFDNDHDGERDHSQGVQWVVVELEPGRCLAVTFEWSRPNNDTHDWKTLKCDEKFGGDFIAALKAHTKEPLLDDWHPKAGDELGWFRSTNARFGSQRYVPEAERLRQPIRWREIPAAWL